MEHGGVNPAARAFEHAQVLAAQRRYAAAVERLKVCLASQPDWPAVHGLLSHCWLNLGDLFRAMEHAKEAIRLAPDRVDGFLHAATVVLNDANYVPPEATVWQRFNRSPSNDPRIRHAMKLLRQALSIEPGNGHAHYLLAYAWLQAEQPPRAVAAAKAGLALAPQDPLLLTALSTALMAAGKHAEATQVTARLLAVDPASAGSHCAHGAALIAAGRAADAEAHLREAVRIDPDDSGGRAQWADAIAQRHPLLRIATRCFACLVRLGLLNPLYLMHICLILSAGIWLILFGAIWLTTRAAGVAESKQLAAISLAIGFGLPLSIVWLRFLGQFLVSRSDRGKHLVPLQNRIACRIVVLAVLPLAVLVAMCATDGGSFLLLTAASSVVPVAVAGAVVSGRPQRGLAAYAVIFMIASVAVAATALGVGANIDFLRPFMAATGIAVAVPFAMLTHYERRHETL